MPRPGGPIREDGSAPCDDSSWAGAAASAPPRCVRQCYSHLTRTLPPYCDDPSPSPCRVGAHLCVRPRVGGRRGLGLDVVRHTPLRPLPASSLLSPFAFRISPQCSLLIAHG